MYPINKRAKEKVKVEKHNMESVVSGMEEFSGLTRSQLFSKKRNRQLADYRHIMRFYAVGCDIDYKEIAHVMGCDRTSIYHSIERTLMLIDGDKDFREKYDGFLELMK